MRTPITYYGGKQMLADKIISMMPAHKIYCEPFFGGGAVFFAKPKSYLEVINDKNDRLITFYRQVVDNFDELRYMVENTLHSEAEYHPSIWAEKGVYNWVLANPIIYNEPIENVKGKLSFWDYPGINEVKIECPECGSIEIAVEDYTTAPFPTYIHSCNKCGYVIMESEWNVIEK